MADRQPPSRALTLGVAVVLAGAGWLLYDGSRTSQPPQPTGSEAFQATGASSAPPDWSAPSTPAVSADTAEPMPASVPVRIRIPTIRVNAPIVPLGLDSTGHLQTPPESDRNLAGWYSDGPTPGSAGNAVLDGHVDTKRGPAVFYNLGALRKNDPIDIERSDGTVAAFSIDAIEVYPKNAFPDERVYGAAQTPELHVITCGGGYSRRHGYNSNVVVYAHLVRGTPGG
jgi:sortase (surface protein transpeptidase)